MESVSDGKGNTESREAVLNHAPDGQVTGEVRISTRGGIKIYKVEGMVGQPLVAKPTNLPSKKNQALQPTKPTKSQSSKSSSVAKTHSAKPVKKTKTHHRPVAKTKSPAKKSPRSKRP